MKKLMLAILVLFVHSAFAAETSTDCPWMKEMNERNNPKSLSATKVVKVSRPVKVSKQ